MADTAAYLVDRVFPRAPVRQWVLSLPRPLRYILARDAGLLSGALGIFVGEIFRDLRRRAGIRRAREGLPGAVTGVQRFGSSLNLNVHFHSLALDGLYVKDPGTGAWGFRRLPPPSKDDLDRVLSSARLKILRFLRRKGYAVGPFAEGSQREEGDESVEPPSVFEVLQAASIRDWIGLSEEARRVPVVGRDPGRPFMVPDDKPFAIASGDGWSLEAGVRIRAGDRQGLERLCRYVLRPPFAGDRIERLGDGRIRYGFRRPRPDGSTHVVLEPVEFLEKLAALVPPPRSHLVRYHGVLAPHARLRERVVPPESPERSGASSCEGPGHGRRESARGGIDEERPPGRPRRGPRRRTPWAELLLRSLDLDVLWCPGCGGRMKVIACIDEPGVVEKVLRAMGLWREVPLVAPARSPPQARFEFVQDSSPIE